MTSPIFSSDLDVMRHAIKIAERGLGRVEPNPMVGAVIVSADGHLIAEGHHQRFGEAHAEINAIRAAGERTAGAELFVSLEPCSHFGKTPPCADAVIAAGFRRVVIGCQDPAPHVAGRGIQKLRDAGIVVEVGVAESETHRLISPFRKLMLHGQPWVHAKWAMSLDGRIATRTGHSKWISCDKSRVWVHELRGRMDAIITGAGTVRADDPLLTARPKGPRNAIRVVLDSSGESITSECQLATTASESEVLVCVSKNCPEPNLLRLHGLGIPTFRTSALDTVDVTEVLNELGRRKCTNVLVEAGPRVLGAFFDAQQIDEVYAFVAPKLIGGQEAQSPLGGRGLERVPGVSNLQNMQVSAIDSDLLIQGDVAR